MKMTEETTMGQQRAKTPIRIRGSVTRVFALKGYFWVEGEDGTDYFAHQVHIVGGKRVDTAWVGQPVTFIPAEGDRGPFATSIMLE